MYCLIANVRVKYISKLVQITDRSVFCLLSYVISFKIKCFKTALNTTYYKYQTRVFAKVVIFKNYTNVYT